jgi:hypothetical protein
VKIRFYFSKNSELSVKILNKIGKTGPIIIQNATIINRGKAANLTVDVAKERATKVWWAYRGLFASSDGAACVLLFWFLWVL